MAAPVIPAIATQDIVVNETTEFVLNIDVTGATSCEVEGDLEAFYATFDATLASNRLKIKGIPKRLLRDKVLTIKATNADGTTTRSFVYNVIPAAPIITRPTGRIKFVRGKQANLYIPVSNKPGNFNAKGLQVGLGHTLEPDGGRIIGAIPNETKLVAARGTLDFEASNGGGVDAENDVPFDILTSEPAFSTFSAVGAFKEIELTFVKPTDARSMAAKVWPSTAAEPSDDLENWITLGHSPATVTGLDTGIRYNVKMRINEAFIGAATPAKSVTPLNYKVLLSQTLMRSANPAIDAKAITWDGTSFRVAEASAIWGFTNGARDTAKDIATSVLRSANTNIRVAGMTWDGESLSVLDFYADAIWGFTNGARDTSKDVAASVLRSANPSIQPEGLTWDGESLSVLDRNADAIWGFTDGARDTAKDIAASVLRSANANMFPTGLTWDGESLRVLDGNADAIWGFTNGVRDTSKDVAASVLKSANANMFPTGLTWDGQNVVVSDENSDTVYAF